MITEGQFVMCGRFLGLCKVIRVHTAGTITVKSFETGRYYRISGLEYRAVSKPTK